MLPGCSIAKHRGHRTTNVHVLVRNSQHSSNTIPNITCRYVILELRMIYLQSLILSSRFSRNSNRRSWKYLISDSDRQIVAFVYSGSILRFSAYKYKTFAGRTNCGWRCRRHCSLELLGCRISVGVATAPRSRI